MRRIVLCADDYAIAPGVSAGIRELIAAGRLNATSVMTVFPGLDAEAAALVAAALWLVAVRPYAPVIASVSHDVT